MKPISEAPGQSLQWTRARASCDLPYTPLTLPQGQDCTLEKRRELNQKQFRKWIKLPCAHASLVTRTAFSALEQEMIVCVCREERDATLS